MKRMNDQHITTSVNCMIIIFSLFIYSDVEFRNNWMITSSSPSTNTFWVKEKKLLQSVKSVTRLEEKFVGRENRILFLFSWSVRVSTIQYIQHYTVVWLITIRSRKFNFVRGFLNETEPKLSIWSCGSSTSQIRLARWTFLRKFYELAFISHVLLMVATKNNYISSSIMSVMSAINRIWICDVLNSVCIQKMNLIFIRHDFTICCCDCEW